MVMTFVTEPYPNRWVDGCGWKCRLNFMKVFKRVFIFGLSVLVLFAYPRGENKILLWYLLFNIQDNFVFEKHATKCNLFQWPKSPPPSRMSPGTTILERCENLRNADTTLMDNSQHWAVDIWKHVPAIPVWSYRQRTNPGLLSETWVSSNAFQEFDGVFTTKQWHNHE